MMDDEEFKNYQSSLRGLLNHALVEALKRNEAQSQTWKDYKKAHEKVKKGLEILPQELSTNCMVPIGRKALMKGKIVHTNEILVCLGEGYFAKYSAKQAIAVCDRRIKQADEMLMNLEKEQSLLEMRQSLPVDHGIFGDEQCKEIIEPYIEEEEKEWRLKHRQREKEYRQKLAKLRAQEKTDIRSEEDLWRRLDELELQEDLEDEIDRLDDDCNYYGEYIQDNEDSYEEEEEEEEDFSEDETTNDMINDQLNKLKGSNMPKHQRDLFEKENVNKETDCESLTIHNVPNSQQPSPSTSLDTVAILQTESSRETVSEFEPNSSTSFSMNETSTENNRTENRILHFMKQDISDDILSQSSETSVSTGAGGSTDVKYTDSLGSSSQSELEKNRTADEDRDDQTVKTQKRRVSFTDKIQVNVFEKSKPHSFQESSANDRESSSESDTEDDIEKQQIMEAMISAGVDSSSLDEASGDSTENKDLEDDVIRIEVKHSKTQPSAVGSSGDNVINDPRDIYRIFCKPKSILKKTSSDLNQSHNVTPPTDDIFDQETEERPFGTSYTIIVKDVEERRPEVNEANVPPITTRPLSKFKMARSGLKR